MGMAIALGLKSLFSVLGCVITATVIYTIITDGLPFRIQLLTPWMAATLIDFYINIFAIGAWVIYKESNWISAVLWVVLLICLGSITTCGYIVLQFFKLSSKESMQDPVFYVLLRQGKMNKPERQIKLCVAVAKVVFIALGCLMLGTLIYTIVTDGSPFRKELYTPWLSATLIDFYINVVALSVWVAYKETSWIRASCWILLLICLGSVSTCAYIVLQLFQLSPQDPAYYILFNRAEEGYEGTLQEDHVYDC
ncbi:PREDICTED: uncharacterized protein LOC109151045 isoform X2 [Ipomoea nil]|uniref:uncharacterized protein LOC109151045 isoform X2 n=1 Tax=Ipomoea nil TaxID=35883 RepID=UPI0009013589|nr:PREDICTED: uncharacterized protein LOC109151045 isoform X2 [Ipomoea nil]